jgi:predicted DNA-binding transcriptional regulator AlpA
MAHEQLTMEDLKVLTLPEIATLEGTSVATLKRTMDDGLGPKVIQLSKRRIGVRVLDYRKWQEQRLRA